jgi:hypothetical protein
MRASVDASGPFGTPIRHPGRDDPGAPGRERRRGGPNRRHRLLCTGLHSDSGQPPGGGAAAMRARGRFEKATGEARVSPTRRERRGARRSTVQHGFGWCWTGAAGWGRGGPLGLLEGWGAISNAKGVRYTATARTSPTRPRTTLCPLIGERVHDLMGWYSVDGRGRVRQRVDEGVRQASSHGSSRCPSVPRSPGPWNGASRFRRLDQGPVPSLGRRA